MKQPVAHTPPSARAVPVARAPREMNWGLFLVACWLVVCGLGLRHMAGTSANSPIICAMDGGVTPPLSTSNRQMRRRSSRPPTPLFWLSDKASPDPKKAVAKVGSAKE
jgi:hypothetical protein